MGRHQQGFTLLELLISSAIGLALMVGVTTALGGNLGASREALHDTRLGHAVSDALGIMRQELRRSGYSRAGGNAFRELVIDADCVLFHYDADHDGILDATGALDDERFGFRLRNGAVEAGLAVQDDGCIEGVWEEITDGNHVSLSALGFTPAAGAGTTTVTIALSGTTRAEDQPAFQVSESVVINNPVDITVVAPAP